jgi:hypothetical protein
MTRKRHMILRPQLIAEMRRLDLDGNVYAAASCNKDGFGYKERERYADKAFALRARAQHLGELAGVPERCIMVGKGEG